MPVFFKSGSPVRANARLNYFCQLSMKRFAAMQLQEAATPQPFEENSNQRRERGAE
jgi:hypothetical protein